MTTNIERDMLLNRAWTHLWRHSSKKEPILIIRSHLSILVITQCDSYALGVVVWNMVFKQMAPPDTDYVRSMFSETISVHPVYR